MNNRRTRAYVRAFVICALITAALLGLMAGAAALVGGAVPSNTLIALGVAVLGCSFADWARDIRKAATR